MSIVSPTYENIVKAAQILRSGGLVSFPTETVYGVGANALDESAVKKIFAVKGRPATNPLIVHISSLADLPAITGPLPSLLSTKIEKLSAFWPGPLSLVLPASPSLPRVVTAGLATVAVRIPSHPIAQELIREAGIPIAAPSANRSSYVSPTTAQHVADGLGDSLEIILNGGPCTIGLESTILSLMSDTPVLLRAGAVTREELETALGKIEVRRSAESGSEAVSSPGLLKEHYCPHTPVVLYGAPVSGYSRIGFISFGVQPTRSHDTHFETVITLSKNGNLNEVANRLFSALRDLDKIGLDLIVIDTCDAQGLGLAIMDRITRAAARTQK